MENADCQATVQDVIDVVDGVNLTLAREKEKMWKEIHDMATNDTPNNWLIILENTSYSLESSTFSSLYHFILMRLVEYIIEYENEKKRESLFSQEDLRLTEDQQQIVRYVAGYIIFSLTKKWKMVYRNKKSMVASAAVDFLKSIRITSNNIRANSFLDFSMKWVELVNRGGLVIVNDDFFIFIRRIENTVRQLLTIDMLRNYRGEDLRDLLMTSLEKHDGINATWDNLSRLIPNDDLRKELKREILVKWVDIRTKSFVKSFVQIIKRALSKLSMEERENAKKDTVSVVTETAMRKGLSS